MGMRRIMDLHASFTRNLTLDCASLSEEILLLHLTVCDHMCSHILDTIC